MTVQQVEARWKRFQGEQGKEKYLWETQKGPAMILSRDLSATPIGPCSAATRLQWLSVHTVLQFTADVMLTSPKSVTAARM